MPNQSGASANDPNVAIGTDPPTAELGPSDAEVNAWAEQERERREAWLRGPTQAQKSDWAAREHTRRLAEQSGRKIAVPRLAPGESPIFLMQRYAREAQLAAEGAMSMMLNLSVRDVVDQLVQAGRDWEEEYTSRPVRRRIALDAETGGSAPKAERGSTGADGAPGTASPTS
jgi:hypothetical protein